MKVFSELVGTKDGRDGDSDTLVVVSTNDDTLSEGEDNTVEVSVTLGMNTVVSGIGTRLVPTVEVRVSKLLVSIVEVRVRTRLVSTETADVSTRLVSVALTLRLELEISVGETVSCGELVRVKVVAGTDNTNVGVTVGDPVLVIMLDVIVGVGEIVRVTPLTVGNRTVTVGVDMMVIVL